jgi:hypothetical protein
MRIYQAPPTVDLAFFEPGQGFYMAIDKQRNLLGLVLHNVPRMLNGPHLLKQVERLVHSVQSSEVFTPSIE